MNGQLLALFLLPPAIWNFYTTFKGLSVFFDLPTHPSINPGQFLFGAIVAVLVIGFVIGIRAIWNLPSFDAPTNLLRTASVICIFVDVIASYYGTKRIISFDVEEPAKALALAIVVVLVVLSKIALSTILFDKRIGG